MNENLIKKEKRKLIFTKIESTISRFVFLLLPLITCLIYLLILKANSLYPFGDKSIAWCDMNQQVIPLLNCFKDVLEGNYFTQIKKSESKRIYEFFKLVEEQNEMEKREIFIRARGEELVINGVFNPIFGWSKTKFSQELEKQNAQRR